MRDAVAMGARELVADLLEDTQMRAVGVLDEAVKQDDHLVKLERVVSHHSDKGVQSILEEEELGALRVRVEKFDSDG